MFVGREQELRRPDDAQWPDWSGYLRTAWRHLQNDRPFGAMGGMGRVYYEAKSRYAARLGLIGVDFDEFLTLFDALDEEYLAFENERAEARRRQQQQSKPSA